ncbi:MAG: glycosyltransferase [Oceanospirillales bacterium]|nr:glycosyltransferase [Oceanospirillales bacterium]
MKVLQLYRTYFPESQGGLEESIRQICLATGALGVEQRILTLARVSEPDVVPMPEGDVFRVPLQLEPASCSIGMSLIRAYREQTRWADVVHLHYPWPFADLVHVLSGTSTPVVLTYHSDIIRQRTLEKLYAPLRSVFFNRVSRFVATSPNYVESSPVLSAMSRPPDVIPLGLAPESYVAPSEQAMADVLTRFGEGFFLFVGVLRYYKGLHNLIQAAAISGLRVVIAGQGPEGGRLKKLAEDLRAHNVAFAGYVSDDVKQALFKRARAVVFPSSERSEAFGVTLLEGQLNRKPLISCDIGTGTSFVNRHGETGLVVPPNDPSALAEAMRALQASPDLAVAMGEAGRQRLDEVFSGKSVGKAYLNLYREMIET